MDPSDPGRLAAGMSNLIRRTPGAEEVCALTRPVVVLLAKGKPITMEELSVSTGVPVDRLRSVLQRSLHAEWTEDGRLEGLGLTLRPTPHSLRVEGTVLYVWTAAEAFVSAVLLERPVRIASSCQVTGVPIQVEVTTEGVVHVEPPTAVMTALTPAGYHRPLRWLDVAGQLFFRSPQVASAWMETRPYHALLDMSQAYEYARRLAATT